MVSVIIGVARGMRVGVGAAELVADGVIGVACRAVQRVGLLDQAVELVIRRGRSVAQRVDLDQQVAPDTRTPL